MFAAVIAARRASGAREDDILQSFIDSKYSPATYGGRALSDSEITGMLIATLFAGQHTSSITSAWTGYLMLANKAAALEPAVAEQRRALAATGDTLDAATLNTMDVLHRNITEAIRLHPPLIMLLRLAKKPFTVTTKEGTSYTVPAGDTVFASPAFSHRLPHVFPEPDAYEPDRFAPPREEDKARPFSFVGFGGGRHGCMGTNFAYLQIKAIWSVLLREFELEMVDPLPEVTQKGLGEERGGGVRFVCGLCAHPSLPPPLLHPTRPPFSARLQLARRRPQVMPRAVPPAQTAGLRREREREREREVVPFI